MGSPMPRFDLLAPARLALWDAFDRLPRNLPPAGGVTPPPSRGGGGVRF